MAIADATLSVVAYSLSSGSLLLLNKLLLTLVPYPAFVMILQVRLCGSLTGARRRLAEAA